MHARQDQPHHRHVLEVGSEQLHPDLIESITPLPPSTQLRRIRLITSPSANAIKENNIDQIQISSGGNRYHAQMAPHALKLPPG